MQNPGKHSGHEETQTPQTRGAASSFFGKRATWLDDWLAIGPDGTIKAMSGKVELGTGVRTALAQIVAEELDVPFEWVHLVMGDTALTPDEGYTAGSMTTHMSGTGLRQAAAEARRRLLGMASERLDVSPDELVVRDGVISVMNHPNRKLTYAELTGGKPFNCEVTGTAPLKRPEAYQIVGTPVSRVDIPRKLTGQPSFIQDLRVPGMLHGRVVRPPSVGAKLLSIDESSVKDILGLIKIVKHGNFVGVVTEREEQAVLAAKRLKVKWQETSRLPSMDDLYELLRSQPTNDETLLEEGDVDNALEQGIQQFHAVYYQPYHAHAAIGPSCAVADVRSDEITVWASVQGPYPLRGALAQLLNVPAEKIRLVHMEGAGCYGHNGADDVTADATLLSRDVERPVRVQWSREDEFAWEPKSPAMMMEVQGALNAKGDIIAWNYDVWSPTHSTRPRFAHQLLASQLMSEQTPSKTPFFVGGDRNAPTNYAFPNQRVTIHWVANSPLRVSAMRSLGGAGNTFANESFMDELAAAAHIDPIEFRLRHLTDPRLREVLSAAAELANWESRPSPHVTPSRLTVGRGVAFVRYENDEAIAACIAHIQVDTATGIIRVLHIFVAFDCGLIINPDGLKNQIEGNIIQSLSRALKEEVKFDDTHILSTDWHSYPILTFSEVPDVDVVLINRPDQPAVGAGEPATVTTAAAVANALFDATGVRLRRGPFTPERVRAALAQSGDDLAQV